MNLKNEAAAINDALTAMSKDLEAITAQMRRDYPEPLPVNDRISYEIRAINTIAIVTNKALGLTMLAVRDLMEEVDRRATP